jgi:hypothetical protein
MTYRRLIAQGVKAARIGSLVGPPPTPSGMPLANATAAVLQARARLEPPARPRVVPRGERRAASV